MKGFRNVFAAGAIGVILAVTGCAQYSTPVTDPSSPLNSDATRSRVVTNVNRYTGNTARNINATRNASRMATAKNTGRTATRAKGRITRTLPSGNQYTSPAVTTNRTRTAVTGNSANTGLVNRNIRNTTGIAGRQTNVPNNRGINNRISTGNVYNTGNVSQYPASNRTMNRTGSPFGDYNKDRAYSLTRNTTDVNHINQTAGSAVRSIEGASGAVRTRNTAGTQATGSSIVRKSFSEGTVHTPVVGEAVAAKPANKTRNVQTASDVKSSRTVKKTKVNKAATQTAKTSQTKANRSAATRTVATGTLNTAAKNTAVTNTAGNTGTTLARNTTSNTGTTLARNTGTALAKNSVINGANIAGSTKLSKITNGPGSNDNVPRVRSSALRRDAINNQNMRSARLQNGNTRGTRSARNIVNSDGTYRNINKLMNNKGTTQANSGVLTRTVYDVNDGIESGASRTATTLYAESPSGFPMQLNNQAVTNNNNRTNSGTVNRSYNRYGYNDDFLRRYNYDNMTYGSTYRNADLRNNYYTQDTQGNYGIYNTNDASSRTYSRTSRGINTGTLGSSRSYYGANYGGNTRSYGYTGSNRYYGMTAGGSGLTSVR